MIQEFKDAFTVTLAKRLTSPFLSTLMLTWCITNYDIILLIFSSNDWNAKIAFIKSIYGFNWDFNLFIIPVPDALPFGRVFWPLGISLFYILAWPRLDMRLYEKSKKLSIEYKKLQMKLEKETPITRKERQELEDKYSKNIKLVREEIIEKESRISELEERNKLSLAKISELENSGSLNRSGISELENENEYLQTKVSTLEDDLVRLSSELKGPIEQAGIEPEARSAVEKDATPEPQGRKFEYTYQITANVRREESRKGNELNESYKVRFNREDLPVEALDKLHDIYYDSEKGRVSDSVPLLIKRLDFDHDRPFKRTESWMLNKSPTDLSDVEILQFWFDDYKESDAEITKAEERQAEEDDQDDITREIDEVAYRASQEVKSNEEAKKVNKKFEFTYKITDKVRKEASRKGKPLDQMYTVRFNQEDLPENIFNQLHDHFYQESDGWMAVNGELTIHRLSSTFGGAPKTQWVLNQNPTDLDDASILQCWFDDYTESVEIIEKAKEKEKKAATIPVQGQTLSDIVKATELLIKGQSLAEMDKEITVVKPYRAKEKLVKRLCDFGIKRHDAATLAELSPMEPMELKRILIAYQVNGISDKAEEVARIIAEEEADRFAETVTARKKEKLEDRLLDAGISVIDTKEIANWASMSSDMTDISIQVLIESDLVSGVEEAKIVVAVMAGIEGEFIGR